MAHPRSSNDPTNWVSMFPTDTVLVGKVIKTAGGMSAVAQSDYLAVTVHAVFVYPVARRGHDTMTPQLVTARRDEEFRFFREPRQGYGAFALWWRQAGAMFSGAVCDAVTDGLVHPAWPDARPTAQPTIVPTHVNVFDLSKSLPQKDGCYE